MTEPIIDDRYFSYPTTIGGSARRRLRIWDTPGGPLAVVTEQMADPGMSITNAAENVMGALQAQYPQLHLGEFVEHYPDSGPEHFDKVTISNGRPVWTAIPPDQLLATLGIGAYPTR